MRHDYVVGNACAANIREILIYLTLAPFGFV
jgi:hypothetical protein